VKNSNDLDVILGELSTIMHKKHADYGPMNISGAPGGAMNGLRVRMYDKLARLNNLVDTGDTPNYESIEDTLIDLANYAIIGLLVQRGQWEGLPNSNGSETKTSSSTERLANPLSKQFSRAGNPKLHPRLQT
jgi:hypothetical protein